ncbi:adenylate kinase-domain-containing protein [Neurospora hispaniola]|uniref:Adenylate kinase-domain-containing protein n=1 Tax=Neurospora hispaniola TaxID=588809 RepID=A0AAJ0I8R1_9PEZI|nr:adenylate kinase-domain-containing protein [Neurospora hispaniola]
MIQAYVSKVSILRTATKTTNLRHNPRFFAVLGGPGSGKSTICATWAKLDGGVMHIGIGDILRSEAKRPDSPYAEVLQANLAKGAIGDPEMTVGLIKDYIRTRIRSATGPIHTYLLDGFPRAVASAQYFERTVGPISKVIVLDIPEATLIDRCLQRNRSDDNHDAIRERIRVYNTKSAEVISAYALRGKVSLLSEPSDWSIRTWAGYWTMELNHKLSYSVEVGQDVIRHAVACGLLIWELCVIRDDCTELNAR